MENGHILIDKPAHMTSFGVVARLKRVLSEQAGKKVKVGHTGTLDPFATGLMIVVVGTECRNAEYYSKLDKTYEATIHLGQTSSTGDPEGELTSVSDEQPAEQSVRAALAQFVGAITQTPPIYSAIKIGGQRAYDRARRGEVIEMPTREVKVASIELLSYSYPEVRIRTDVSSGTYIRTLAQDVGDVLATGAYCTQLRRMSVGTWSLDDAKTLESFGITS